MKLIEWLLKMENNVVWITGSNSLIDLRLAIHGFSAALRFLGDKSPDPFYPGFQRYIESVYDLQRKTAKSWARIIMEHSESEDEAMKSFYKHLKVYAKEEGYLE